MINKIHSSYYQLKFLTFFCSIQGLMRIKSNSKDNSHQYESLLINENRTGVINDPLSQPAVPAGSDFCSI